MTGELLRVHPSELTFTFELKSQSSCSLQLANNSDQHVAYKVKTTTPKKYCVRPNIGVVLPNSTCEIVVTMQAPKTAPPDLQCKDKFLVQSTIVPADITLEDITPDLFVKEEGKYVEEKKLKVLLISPPHSPVLQPINGNLWQEPTYEALKPKEQSFVVNDYEDVKPKEQHTDISDHEFFKRKESVPALDNYLASRLREQPLLLNENTHQHHSVATLVNGMKLKTDEIEDLSLKRKVEVLSAKGDDFEDLKRNLEEAERTIRHLKEESAAVIAEKESLKRELVMVQRMQMSPTPVGYPFLFVCFTCAVSFVIGYILR